MFFAKIPRGSQGFQEKLPGGGVPYFGFYCIFINKCFEICLRGVLYLPSPLPPTPCAHLWVNAIRYGLFQSDHLKLKSSIVRHSQPQPQTTLKRCHIAKINMITGLSKKFKSRFKGRSGEKERK